MLVVKPWTCGEEEALRVLGPVIGGPACAELFERSLDSVYVRASRLGVRLRRRKDFDRVLTGFTNPVVVKRVCEVAVAPLCPACAKRPIGVRRTGLCGPCHLDALRAIHEEKIAAADAQRELWAARSKLQRRRRSLIRVVEMET